MLDSNSLEMVRQLAVGGPGEGVIRVRWHPRINQIAVSTSAGKVKVSDSVLFCSDSSHQLIHTHTHTLSLSLSSSPSVHAR